MLVNLKYNGRETTPTFIRQWFLVFKSLYFGYSEITLSLTGRENEIGQFDNKATKIEYNSNCKLNNF